MPSESTVSKYVDTTISITWLARVFWSLILLIAAATAAAVTLYGTVQNHSSKIDALQANQKALALDQKTLQGSVYDVRNSVNVHAEKFAHVESEMSLLKSRVYSVQQSSSPVPFTPRPDRNQGSQ